MTIARFVAMLTDRGLSDVFAAWLVWSLKGSVLLVLAWAATVTMRRGSAAVRHLVWASALAGMLSLPALARVVPAIHVTWLSDLRTNVTVVRETTSIGVVAVGPRAADQSVRISAMPDGNAIRVPQANAPIQDVQLNVSNGAPASISIGLLVALVWVGGVGVLLLRAVGGLLQLSLWRRRAAGVHDADWLSLTQRLAERLEIGRPVTLLRSERACVPMTWGVVYPRILLPADADSWLSGRRTLVLLHELAHIKRLDTLTQLLAQVSTALFWFHPGVWFAAREMRREREHACDDFVLDAGARASEYAHSLLQIARPLVTGVPAAAALAMARKSELEGRLLAILDPRTDRRPASRIRLAMASVALVGLAIPLAAVSPSHAKAREAPPAAATRALPIARPAPTAIPTETPPVSVQTDSVASAGTNSVVIAATDSVVIATAVATTPAVVPPPSVTPIAPERPTWSRLMMVAHAAKKTPDVETLIAVTRAATKISSDHEKAEVLLTVAKHYVRNDELRSAYFDAVLSMHSDFERTRVLEPVLMKDTLPASASPQFVRIAETMSSDNVRGSLILRLTGVHSAMAPAMRSALIAVVGTLHSDYERGRSIAAIARRGDLSADETLRLIALAKSMSSSSEKANSLLAIAGSRTLDTPELRRAYLAAAETITSPFDYRRAVVRVIE